MPKFVKKYLKFGGMHCRSCEALIKDEVSAITGVKEISADYATQEGHVVYDKTRADINNILRKIRSKGYSAAVAGEEHGKKSGAPREPESKWRGILGISAIALGLIALAIILLKIYGMLNIPELTANMSYGLIFIVGLFTGFHCIAMCGGFVVSYVAKNRKVGGSGHMSHIVYGAGKVVSYTVIGALFGLLGSFIAFTPALRATIGLFAGLFLILFGLNLLNVFPFLRKFQFKMPAFISRRVNSEQSKHSSPFVVGLLNGLMIACGPLQAMYVFAAGTGSALEGAKVMFAFGLGTLPLLLGFGIAASKISAKATHSIIKYSGLIVILLGIILLNRSLILYGTGYDLESLAAKAGLIGAGPAANISNAEEFQAIHMDVTRSGFVPNKFFLKKGVPVKWIITGSEITGCNREILVPEYNLKIEVVPGEQTVEFTPTRAGTILWSCWMGMLRGSFVVSE